MKEEIREKILYRRTQQPPADKAPKDEKIIQAIKELPEFQKAKTVLMYIAIHGEVDLTKLFEEYRESKKFLLPRVNQKEMTLSLYHIKSMDDLEKGSFSIPEPREGLPQIPMEDIELAIIPGVAFAPDGHRVGYGGGFYDRLLKKINCPKIGVAYEFQIVENIEGEDHDARVDIIVTEGRLARIQHP